MPQLFVEIACDYHLSEVVIYVSKGKGLLVSFFSIGNSVRRLYVDSFVCFVDDKVNFVLSYFVFAGCACLKLNNSDINRVSTTNKFVIYDILHEMGLFVLPKVDSGIAHSRINCVVFVERLEVFASFYVISPSFCYKKGVFKQVKIFADSDIVCFHLGLGVYRVAYFIWIR